MSKTNMQRMDDLLASVTSDMLGDLPSIGQDKRMHVERLLLVQVSGRG